MVTLVTGAAGGIGRDVVRTLSREGHQIVISDHPSGAAGARALAEELQQANDANRISVILCDVTIESDVVAMMHDVQEVHGRLDALVNNAGISQAQDVFETSLDDWRRVMDTNLTSCFLCSREAMRLMREQKSGRIVNITSVAGQQGAVKGHVHYAASKAGMIGFTKTLARTAAEFGVTVNAIAPGIIDTTLLRSIHGDDGVERLAAGIPLGLGRTSDVASAVSFLCSEGARYITGAVIDVNGGLYMR